jgi:hypothetical protein
MMTVDDVDFRMPAHALEQYSLLMSNELFAVALAGVLGVVGTVIGTLLTTWLSGAAERRRLAAEDERRWLADRRRAYAGYLLLSESLLREIDEVASHLPYSSGDKLTNEDDAIVKEALSEYFGRWERDLQACLSDLQLVAGSNVADLAGRVSGALMEITAPVELRYAFVKYYPGWFRAQDLLEVLRNDMRGELGLRGSIKSTYPRDADWPWLPGRPSEEEYIRRQSEIPGRPPLSPEELDRLSQQ